MQHDASYTLYRSAHVECGSGWIRYKPTRGWVHLASPSGGGAHSTYLGSRCVHQEAYAIGQNDYVGTVFAVPGITNYPICSEAVYILNHTYQMISVGQSCIQACDWECIMIQIANRPFCLASRGCACITGIYAHHLWNPSQAADSTFDIQIYMPKVDRTGVFSSLQVLLPSQVDGWVEPWRLLHSELGEEKKTFISSGRCGELVRRS